MDSAGNDEQVKEDSEEDEGGEENGEGEDDDDLKSPEDAVAALIDEAVIKKIENVLGMEGRYEVLAELYCNI